MHRFLFVAVDWCNCELIMPHLDFRQIFNIWTKLFENIKHDDEDSWRLDKGMRRRSCRRHFMPNLEASLGRCVSRASLLPNSPPAPQPPLSPLPPTLPHPIVGPPPSSAGLGHLPPHPPPCLNWETFPPKKYFKVISMKVMVSQLLFRWWLTHRGSPSSRGTLLNLPLTKTSQCEAIHNHQCTAMRAILQCSHMPTDHPPNPHNVQQCKMHWNEIHTSEPPTDQTSTMQSKPQSPLHWVESSELYKCTDMPAASTDKSCAKGSKAQLMQRTEEHEIAKQCSHPLADRPPTDKS